MATHLSYSNYSEQTEVTYTIEENTQALPISHTTHLLESCNKDLQLPPAGILK